MSDGALLHYVGYSPLRPGRIHLYCPGCHRKTSNVERGEYDPAAAVVAHVWCEGCADSQGEAIYLDAHGRFLDWETGLPEGASPGTGEGR